MRTRGRSHPHIAILVDGENDVRWIAIPAFGRTWIGDTIPLVGGPYKIKAIDESRGYPVHVIERVQT